MNCPICQYPDLKADIKVCPNCKTDLEVYKHIDALNRKTKNNVATIRFLRLLLIILVIVIGTAAFLFFSTTDFNQIFSKSLFKSAPQPLPGISTDSASFLLAKMSELENEKMSLNDSMINFKMQLQAKEQELDSVKLMSIEPKTTFKKSRRSASAPQQTRSVNDNIPAASNATIETHLVIAGESLWIIAVKEFGNGFKYAKIARDNNISNPDIVEVGTELKIIRHNKSKKQKRKRSE